MLIDLMSQNRNCFCLFWD